jgi:hypothetical protein
MHRYLMHKCRRALATLALVAAVPVIACAQSAGAVPNPLVPRNFVVRTDAPSNAHRATDSVKVDVMKPGWHITTGPAAILYDSTMRGAGNWRVEAVLHLFSPGARAEGFGVFFGGTALTSTAPKYSYALVRRDGRALLKVRDGATTRTVRDWTMNAAVPVWRGTPNDPSTRYNLVIEAVRDRVTMSIGGVRVLDAARSEMPADGIVGLRINHAVEVHVERLTVTPLVVR